MRLIKAQDLAKQLGISCSSINYLCKNNPEMATKGPGIRDPYYIHLDKIPGIDLITALLLPTRRWMKAVEVARRAGKSRKSVNNWCRSRSKFAIRLGRIWYMDVTEWETSSGQIAL